MLFLFVYNFMILFKKSPIQRAMFRKLAFFRQRNYRSSHWRCSVKKKCSQKFKNIHRKTPVLESLLVAPATLLKKQTLAQMFSRQFCTIFKNIFFTEPLQKNASAKQQNIKNVSFFCLVISYVWIIY